jgi:hypothetical protein
MAIVCPTREAEPARASKKKHGVEDSSASELDPVQYHLQAACQIIRDLPLRDLAREQFYNWIYHHIYVATNLIADDNYCRRTGKIGPASPEQLENTEFVSDLDLIKG